MLLQKIIYIQTLYLLVDDIGHLFRVKTNQFMKMIEKIERLSDIQKIE